MGHGILIHSQKQQAISWDINQTPIVQAEEKLHGSSKSRLRLDVHPSQETNKSFSKTQMFFEMILQHIRTIVNKC